MKIYGGYILLIHDFHRLNSLDRQDILVTCLQILLIMNWWCLNQSGILLHDETE